MAFAFAWEAAETEAMKVDFPEPDGPTTSKVT